jgi:hypothetical protein
MEAAGLADVQGRDRGPHRGTARGAAVLDDPILTRDGTCQLSLLSDAEFDDGLARIREGAAGRVASPSAPTCASSPPPAESPENAFKVLNDTRQCVGCRF